MFHSFSLFHTAWRDEMLYLIRSNNFKRHDMQKFVIILVNQTSFLCSIVESFPCLPDNPVTIDQCILSSCPSLKQRDGCRAYKPCTACLRVPTYFIDLQNMVSALPVDEIKGQKRSGAAIYMIMLWWSDITTASIQNRVCSIDFDMTDNHDPSLRRCTIHIRIYN